MGVEPQKSQSCAAHGRTENKQLACAGDVRNEQVLCKHGIAGHVGKHTQCAANQHHGHDGQTIQPVRQVDGVAGANDDQVREDDETEHAQRVGHFLEERHPQACCGWQVNPEPRGNPVQEQLKHFQVGAFRHGKRQVQRRHQPHERLPEVFFARAHALWVFAHDLAPVVYPANGTEPQGDDQDNPDEPV